MAKLSTITESVIRSSCSVTMSNNWKVETSTQDMAKDGTKTGSCGSGGGEVLCKTNCFWRLFRQCMKKHGIEQQRCMCVNGWMWPYSQNSKMMGRKSGYSSCTGDENMWTLTWTQWTLLNCCPILFTTDPALFVIHRWHEHETYMCAYRFVVSNEPCCAFYSVHT